MTRNVRLQKLRDFTVGIRDANDQIVGTGIAVSTDGKIVTCAHVVEAAIGVHPRDAKGSEVGIYFPQLHDEDEKKRLATVDCCFPQHDDDMVLLQLVGGASPLAPEQIAVLGMADNSEGNPFRTYGYSPIGEYPATRGDGEILGSIEPPLGRNLQADPIQLRSRDIATGMSGAAVLDVLRNLVVGLVAERYYPEGAVQDDIGYGVDSKVLTFNPFGFALRGEALELEPAPEPKFDKQEAKAAVLIQENYAWHNAPNVLPEWIGRDDLLAQITSDWNDSTKHVTGLIGFGGEGKSSLARKWIDNLLNNRSQLQPEGVFWWGFYENRSVDEFLEATLNYLSGGRINARQVQSSNLRTQIIGAMLGTGHYLFVLDGIEVMQHQEGDQYGLLQSNDLRDLLSFFARSDSRSFCLITSRAPLLDLMEYTTYTHRDVDRLSEADGRALLQRLGVKGSDNEFNKVVADWDGHALTLSILAAYLAEQYKGDIKYLADIPAPMEDEPRYERVHRVLRRYDEHLTNDEREFLKFFSLFRVPVRQSAFEKVFEPLLKQKGIVARLFGSKADSRISNIVERLTTYRIIRLDEHKKTYTTHPLIRNYYLDLFMMGDPSQRKAAHQRLKQYYLSIAGDATKYPTLDDLTPLIEVVHHSCQAGAYDEAYEIRRQRIYQGSRNVLTYQLGASETDLNLMLEFFTDRPDRPDINTIKEPLVRSSKAKRVILNEIGMSLMSLGRLRDAESFYKQVAELDEKLQDDLKAASDTLQNIAYWHESLGALHASAEAARQALDLARRADDKQNEWSALANLAWVTHLLGDIDLAVELFTEAEGMFQQEHPRFYFYGLNETPLHYLYGINGIRHADHLQRINQDAHAGRVAGANVDFCENKHWPDDTSRSYRVLADVNSSAGSPVLASLYYEKALKLARSIQQRDVLIQALLAHGRFIAKTSDVSQAFSDLNEALAYCVESGYRIYEADVRVALCWAYLATNEKQKAKDSAERAIQMSNGMGYYWGKVDAQEVLDLIPTVGARARKANDESKPTRNTKSVKTKKTSKPTNTRKKKPK